MSAPLLTFALTAVFAVVSLGLRRRRAAAFAVAALGSLSIGVFILGAPIGSARPVLGVPIEFEAGWRILGRLTSLTPQSRSPVAFLYLIGALYFVAGYLARPGRSFAPLGLITLGLLAGSLTIEPFLYAAIFLQLAALTSILVLNPPGSGQDPGSIQLLVLYTLAMMAILFTGWLLDNVGITSVTPELAGKVMSLLGLGFSILMFVPPFHFWLGRSAESVNPLALAFVAVCLQSAGFFFLLRFLDGLEWLRNQPQVGSALMTVGLLTASFGALAAIAQVLRGKVIAYLLVADFGVTLAALSSNNPERLQLVLLHLGIRAVSLMAWGLGASLAEGSSEQIGEATGRVPLTAALLSLLGAMGLAGLPPTGGFAIRYGLLSVPHGVDRVAAGVLVGSMLLGMLAVLRWVPETLAAARGFAAVGQPRSERWALAAVVVVCAVLALLPQSGLAWVGPAAEGFANLGP